MTKQKYEEKRIITICGVLNKISDGEYTVTVTEKENEKEYSLNNILDAMDECVISLTSEMF